MYLSLRVPGSKAIYRNVNKSLNFRILYLIPYPFTVGVPQGSIMGPVLFTLYVNDLFRVPKHCEPLGYVDDTKLFLGFPASELDDVISAVNENLKQILIWCGRNSLPINPDKTKLLHVGVPQLMRTLPTR